MVTIQRSCSGSTILASIKTRWRVVSPCYLCGLPAASGTTRILVLTYSTTHVHSIMAYQPAVLCAYSRVSWWFLLRLGVLEVSAEAGCPGGFC